MCPSRPPGLQAQSDKLALLAGEKASIQRCAPYLCIESDGKNRHGEKLYKEKDEDTIQNRSRARPEITSDELWARPSQCLQDHLIDGR